MSAVDLAIVVTALRNRSSAVRDHPLIPPGFREVMVGEFEALAAEITDIAGRMPPAVRLHPEHCACGGCP